MAGKGEGAGGRAVTGAVLRQTRYSALSLYEISLGKIRTQARCGERLRGHKAATRKTDTTRHRTLGPQLTD